VYVALPGHEGEDTKMPRKGHTEEQILQVLRKAERGSLRSAES
jgi:hypothetical protein